jgi:hypothetical protein
VGLHHELSHLQSHFTRTLTRPPSPSHVALLRQGRALHPCPWGMDVVLKRGKAAAKMEDGMRSKDTSTIGTKSTLESESSPSAAKPLPRRRVVCGLRTFPQCEHVCMCACLCVCAPSHLHPCTHPLHLTPPLFDPQRALCFSCGTWTWATLASYRATPLSWTVCAREAVRWKICSRPHADSLLAPPGVPEASSIAWAVCCWHWLQSRMAAMCVAWWLK